MRRLISAKSFPATLEVLRVDCASCHGKMDDYLYLLDFLYSLNGEPAVPPPLVTGRDLIRLGMKPGREMGKILSEIADLQLEGRLRSREEAMNYLSGQFSKSLEI